MRSVATGAEGRIWRVLQGAGVAVTLALVAGLVWRPEPTLGLLWNMVIPMVPALLLISPLLWRNVCPLATLNMAGNRFGTERRASSRWVGSANVLGIALLALMVPARRFLFNGEGPALAVTILAVAALAVIMGVLFDGRAGFCNALCPVLPVERLYGQSPLLPVKRARCASCSACGRACIDLAPRRSVFKLAGRRGGASGWLFTPIGAFAAAFPGFVLGYFTTVDGPLSTAGRVYLWILSISAASYLLVFVAARLFRVDREHAIPVLGGLAASLYYWFAAPSIADALGAAGIVAAVIRTAALGLVAWWITAASRSRGRRGARRPGPLVGQG